MVFMWHIFLSYFLKVKSFKITLGFASTSMMGFLMHLFVADNVFPYSFNQIIQTDSVTLATKTKLYSVLEFLKTGISLTFCYLFRFTYLLTMAEYKYVVVFKAAPDDSNNDTNNSSNDNNNNTNNNNDNNNSS